MVLKSIKMLGKAALLSLFVLGVSSAADMNSSYNAGINAADQTKGVLTSGQRDKLYAPLTTDTPMTTLDGSKSGKVNLRCEGANPFTLEFYFIPVGHNNYRLIIRRDNGSVVLDTDKVTYEKLSVTNTGIMTNTVYTGITISGVCENGLVYCKDDVWDKNHCYYFKYVADKSGNLSLIQVELNKDTSNDLGQCSCTSESCGWVNIVPYTYVVGGVSRALMMANPKYQMSNGYWDSSQLKYTYYGMDTSNCTSASKNAVAPGDDNLSRFYSPNGGTDIDRGTLDSVIYRQSQNQNSPYSVAMKLQNVQYSKGGETIKVSKPDLAYCFVNNDVGIAPAHPPPHIGFRYIIVRCADNTFRVWCDASGTSCGEVCGVCDFDGNDGDHDCSIGYCDKLCVSARVNGSIVTLDYKGYDEITRSDPSSVISFTTNVDSFGGSVSIPSGFDSNVVSLTGVVGERAILVTHDGCTPYEGNSKCHVLNKWICKRGETVPENCIRTGSIDGGFGSINAPNQLVRNGAKVSDGSNYPAQCYTYSTGIATYQICESPTSALTYRTIGGDFDAAAGSGSFSVLDGRFTVLYQYQCEDDSSINIERSKGTMASLSMNGNTATFRDPAHPEKGTQVISSPKFSSCLDTFCLVKTSCSTTEVNADSTNKAQTQGGTTVLYDKRKCVRTSNLKYDDNTTPSFTCPVNPGETILANCDCEENIDVLTNTTISVLEAVDQMTKDWICSSN